MEDELLRQLMHISDMNLELQNLKRPSRTEVLFIAT